MITDKIFVKDDFTKVRCLDHRGCDTKENMSLKSEVIDNRDFAEAFDAKEDWS